MGEEILEDAYHGDGRTIPRQRETERAPLTEDRMFEVVSNQRRRYALRYLKRHDGDVAMLRDLAEQVAAWEYDKPVWDLTADERKTVKNALHQFHLPKMADYGVVRYNAQRGLVALTDTAADVEVYVEVVPGRDIPWGPYYLVFTALHAPVVVARWFEVGPLAHLPWVALLIYFMVAVAVSAGVHSYYGYSRMRLGAGDPTTGGDPDA